MFNDISGQVFFNIRMARDLLNHSGLWVLINIMFFAMPDKNGSPLAYLFKQQI
jgi:hypothetical protein